MILTIATDADLVITVECVQQDTVSAVKDKVASQLGIPKAEQGLLFQGRMLNDGDTMESVGVVDGDLFMLQRNISPVPTARSNSGLFGNLTRDQFLDHARRNPQLLTQLDTGNPELARAIRENDGDAAENIVRQAKEREAAKQREIAQLMMNPMDIESQKKIEELIKQKNIEENYMQALEHTPEVFGSVSMLYVNMEVNGVPVQAFVDTGAQMTIMTEQFAEKCSLTRLIDKRFTGMALGVGQSKIVGRVHQAPLKVSNEYVTSSLVVMEQKSGPPFIFGLDNLIRHQCTLDLNRMKLKFGSINVEVSFLAEHQIVQRDERITEKGSSATTSTPAATRTANTGNVPEEKIERLMALGFGRQQCLDALRATNGNEDAAAAILFGSF